MFFACFFVSLSFFSCFDFVFAGNLLLGFDSFFLFFLGGGFLWFHLLRFWLPSLVAGLLSENEDLKCS